MNIRTLEPVISITSVIVVTDETIFAETAVPGTVTGGADETVYAETAVVATVAEVGVCVLVGVAVVTSDAEVVAAAAAVVVANDEIEVMRTGFGRQQWRRGQPPRTFTGGRRHV